MRLTLRAARLVDALTDLPAGDITIDDERIVAIGAVGTGTGEIIDVHGSLVVPGFIDVHTHGGGGFALHTRDAEEIRAYARWVPTTGVTAFLAGVVGTPHALPTAQIAAAVQATSDPGPGAEMLGIHLEGPYLSPGRRGAHPLVWLRLPDPVETETLLQLSAGQLRVLTLAPELPGAHALISRLVEQGVTVSIGHTDATYEQTEEALALGITHATHCFNAMPPLLHRVPGPLAALLRAPSVRGEIIVDGIHVHPAVVDLLFTLLGPQRTVVVTDALAVAGLPADATFEFAGQTARVQCGAAYLTDGTLSGSVLTMHQALQNLLSMTHATLSEAIGMLTHNPAQVAGVATHKGLLATGYDADLLLLDASSLRIQATLCRGQLAYVSDQWCTPLADFWQTCR